MADGFELTTELINAVRATQLGENLNAEFKRALDITSDRGKCELVRSLFALRNRNGGHLFVGINDDRTIANRTDCPLEQLNSITGDEVQAVIGKFASQKFACAVQHPQKDGETEFVVIYVEGGVTVPVICTADLLPQEQKGLKKRGLYFRTLEANHKYSTSEIPVASWPELMEICFRNREADIAGFLQRNFSEKQIAEFRKFACGPQTPEPPPTPAEPPPTPTTPSTSESQALEPPSQLMSLVISHSAASDAKLHAFIKRGEEGFRARNTNPDNYGFFSTLVELQPPLDLRPTREFIEATLGANPKLTGWPAWVELWNASNAETRPKVRDGAWECYAMGRWDSVEEFTDFWRIEPTGTMFVTRAYQDDIPDGNRKPPKTQLDFGLPILRIAERFEASRQMLLKGMGAPETSVVNYLFRFDKLRGRELTYWAQPGRYISPGRVAEQDDITIPYALPLTAGEQAIVEATYRVVSELYILFEGFQLSRSVTEDLVLRLLQRRMI